MGVPQKPNWGKQPTDVERVTEIRGLDLGKGSQKELHLSILRWISISGTVLIIIAIT